MDTLKKDIIESVSVKNGKNISSRIKEIFFKNNHFDLYNQIIDYYDSLNIARETLFKEKIWIWVNSEKDFPRCRCGNYTKILPNWQSGYRSNCSYECVYVNPDYIKNKEKQYSNISKERKKEILEKIKKTNLEKFGVDHYSKTNDYKQKIKKTNLEKYGVDHYSKTDEYINRVKETSIKKWGVDNFSKTEEFKQKSSNTNLQRYGVDNYTKTREYLLKVMNTNELKWKTQFYMNTDDFKNKSKITNLKKYGVDHYSKTSEYKEKVKNTSMQKWGVDNYTKTKDYLNKRKNTLLLNIGSESIKANEEHRKDNFKIANDDNYISYSKDSISIFRCDLEGDHEFEIVSSLYHTRKRSNLPICTVCYPVNKTSSIKEDILHDYIKKIYDGELIKTYKDGLEIDIYLPKLKIGFEYNGLYWHSDLFIDKNQHLRKSDFFKEKGIKVFHIWEDDWIFNTEIVKSKIKSLIRVFSKEIMTSECEIKEVDSEISSLFLNMNHIDGDINSKIKLGLYYNDELVYLMLFDKIEEGSWCLLRFCNKLDYNIIDSASMVLKYFSMNYNPYKIISYVDKDWLISDLYYKLGFSKLYDTEPDYKFIIKKKRIDKSILEFDLNMPKIWDCGKTIFQIIL